MSYYANVILISLIFFTFNLKFTSTSGQYGAYAVVKFNHSAPSLTVSALGYLQPSPWQTTAHAMIRC
jgi:hypothetical protein